jgi:putative YpdA family bacillithiol system oxidoreductase
METLIAFLVAAMVTLFFVRGYLKKLTLGQKIQPVAKPREMAPCPRCSKQMEQGTAFCPHCGAPMAMWNVHRAQQAVPTATAAAPAGKAQPVINASLCIGCGSCVDVCPETGTLELVGGKAILAHPERCTGHAKCSEVCPTQAISLSIGGVLQTIRVPNVKDNFETNVPGVFIVGELAGFGLIKTAINEGKLVIDHLRSRIPSGQPAEDFLYDVAIIGAGPAGLSASLAAQQYGLRYVTLEQGEIASTIRQYPRQKFLMAEPIEIPLYGNLYVGDGTKEALLSVWETIINNTGVKVHTNERVEGIRRNSAGFHVDTGKGDYRARFVVLALGKRGTPRKLGVPGEELAKVSYRLIEADSYEGKNILVVGGGDSAIEAALALGRSGKNQVALCHRGANFQRARQRNREQIEAGAAAGKIPVFYNSRVKEVQPARVVIDLGSEFKTLSNDFVFVLIGGETPDEFLQKTGIEIVEKSVSAVSSY